MNDAIRIDAAGAVRTITLNRAEKHNAFDDALIAVLTDAFVEAGNDPAVRVVVLESTGPSFSAGADLGWMKRMAGYSAEENLRDARALARLMAVIDRCPKPVLGMVQGPAYGGGVGLVACCDIAVAAEPAIFCLSEVRLGLMPAAISPYVIAAMGARACRRYFLTAEHFDSATALRLGLVHEVVAATELSSARDRLVAALLAGGPQAVAAAKDLIVTVLGAAPGHDLAEETARRIAALRASDEGREGVDAFLDKRKPAWTGHRGSP